MYIANVEMIVDLSYIGYLYKVHVGLRLQLSKKGTYHVQTNLSVQTMETLIWIIGSTSKGHGGFSNFTIWTYTWIGNHTFANPPSHPSAPLPLDVDPMAQIEVSIVLAQIEVSIVCMKRLVCT